MCPCGRRKVSRQIAEKVSTCSWRCAVGSVREDAGPVGGVRATQFMVQPAMAKGQGRNGFALSSVHHETSQPHPRSRKQPPQGTTYETVMSMIAHVSVHHSSRPKMAVRPAEPWQARTFATSCRKRVDFLYLAPLSVV